jgi:hypothetical protein
MWRTSRRCIPTFQSRQLPPLRGLSALRGWPMCSFSKLEVEFNKQDDVCVTSRKSSSFPVVSGDHCAAHWFTESGLKTFSIIVCFYLAVQPTQWARPSSFTRFLDHTQRHATVGRTPLYEWSTYLQKPLPGNTQQTSMSPVGFEPTISAGERSQTDALYWRGHWERRQCYCTILLPWIKIAQYVSP